MTLTEFLLARIAEDEGDAARQEPHRNHCEVVVYGASDRTNCDCDYPARVLAECEAKRRIVGLHYDQHDDTGDPLSYDYPYVGCTTLRVLALPYADHPDYQEAWKP